MFWLETIEISKQRTAFIWCFAQEVDWCLKDCDKQRLQTTVSINLYKIFVGHTGDWFDVRTASICTTDLWHAVKSFILNSLKFKVAPYPIRVSLDTLTFLPLGLSLWNLAHLFINQGSHRFFKKNQDFFKTFSRPKVKTSRRKKSNNAACFLLLTQKLCCFRASHPGNMRWSKMMPMHAYLSQLWNDLLAWSNDQTFDHAKNSFEVSGRDSEGDRSPTLPQRPKFECTARFVIPARRGHGHSTQAPPRSAGHLMNWTHRKKQQQQNTVKRSMLLTWLGQVRQLAYFLLLKTFS